MRIATRLVLVLVTTVAAVMATYAAVSQAQREALLREALSHETRNLAATLRIAIADALRNGSVGEVRRVLGDLVRDPEMFVVAVLDHEQAVIAGGADRSMACLAPVLPRPAEAVRERGGWAHCNGERVRWVVLAVPAPGSALVVSQRATVIHQAIHAASIRIAVLTVVLILTAALTIVLVLQTTLSAPLAQIMRGIRRVGAAGEVQAITVPPYSGELTHLAGAFNEMMEKLHAARAALIRDAEARVAMERRLRHAEAFAMIGRVSGGLAHELGSPLTVIGGRAEAIAQSHEASDAIRSDARGIMKEAARISDLVDGLLHAGTRHDIDRAPVDLTRVVAGVGEEVAKRASAAGVELDVRACGEPVFVLGEATLLHHALLNLVRNAMQAVAGQPGERIVTVRMRRAAGDWLQVIVEDTGPGISEEQRTRIFEPFYTTKGTGAGSGLGLPVTNGIVEEHGGSLRIEPRTGGGARAVATFPAFTQLTVQPEAE